MRILMVCLGNICRSPMAEGIMQRLVAERGLDWEIDSAGTSNWHAGEQPDSRAVAECARRGLDISHQRSRQFHMDDFEEFDLILTMDRTNYEDVFAKTPHERHRKKLYPITDFLNDRRIDHVPDPYFDGSFESVFDLLDELCNVILDTYASSVTND